ncbi:MAG TPA: SusE domain-containing protein, partial [Puia sp.]
SAVTALYTPADSQYIKLNPAANISQTFQWQQAHAEDGSLVLYEVAFDQIGGDFSHPFYSTVSDGKGVQNTLTLTHGDLNKIASLGGADFFERKKFIWTVFSSKGTNRVKAKVFRVIDLERPAGFAVLPANIYLTGSATEAGTNLSAALPMKQTASGEFEIYTKLTAGTYHFVDATTGTPKSYYLDSSAGVLEMKEGGETTFTGADKVMRIRLSFNNVNGSLAEVKSIQLWYCAANAFWCSLPYVSNGVWRYNGFTIAYVSMPWGFEDRYKYKMLINDGTGDKDQWLNYSSNDSPGQDGQYPGTLAYKTINFDANNSSQWDWSWKFDKTYLPQGSTADFWISLKATDPAYTQNYQKE